MVIAIIRMDTIVAKTPIAIVLLNVFQKNSPVIVAQMDIAIVRIDTIVAKIAIAIVRLDPFK